MPNDETPETTPASDDSGFEWMSDTSDSGDAQAEPAADTPDWLSQMAPASEESAEPEDAADDSGFQWMSDVNANEAEAEPAASVPDWLSQMAPADDDAEPASAPAAEEGGFEWISEVNADDEPEAEPALDTPDWLSQMAPADDEPEAAASTPAAEDSGFEWISEVNADDDAEAEPALDTPDWLSQMAPAGDEDAEPESAASAPATEESGFEWISEVDADNEPEAEAAADVPDWLSQMAPADNEDAEPEPTSITLAATESSFEWISEVNADDEPEAEPAVDTPDWLSEIAPADDEEAEPEASSNVPDWLAQVKPSAAQTTTLEDPNAEFAWEDSLDSDQEEEAESDEAAPEWLSNIQSSQSSTPEEPVEEPVGGGFSWINDMQDQPDESAVPEANEATARTFEPDDFGDAVEEEVAAAPEPASNAPDWLNAMVPGLDVDYDAPEDEPLEESYVEDPAASAENIAPIQNKREFDWLMNIVEEETQQVHAITDSGKQRRFVFSRQPAWLRQPTEVKEKPSTIATETQDDDFDDVDLPPWLQ